jgi:hypothetical protein
MANRTPISHHDDQPTAELFRDAKPATVSFQSGLLCGHEETRFKRTYVCVRTPHDGDRHDLQPAEYAAEVAARRHADVVEAKRLVAEERARLAAATQPMTPAATAPPGGADGTADPTRAGVPDGERPSEPRGDAGSDAAGSGRPLIVEVGVCTDCGGTVTFDEIVDHWWHENPDVAAMPAYGLDGHIVHRDKLPPQHPDRFQPWFRSDDGGGRDPFTGRFRSKAPSAELAAEHALIDMDAGLYADEVARRTSMALTAVAALGFLVEVERAEVALAVKAGMLVRLGSDGGGS